MEKAKADEIADLQVKIQDMLMALAPMCIVCGSRNFKHSVKEAKRDEANDLCVECLAKIPPALPGNRKQ